MLDIYFRRKSPNWLFFAKNRQIGDFSPKNAKLALFAENRQIGAFRRKSPNWRFFLEIAKSDLFTKNRQIGAFSLQTQWAKNVKKVQTMIGIYLIS